MPSPHGIVISIVGDERSYLRSVENTIATNTKLDASFKQVGVNANLSADAQIKAAVKAHEALRVNALALSSRAASLPSGSREQAAATLLAAEAQAKYARAVGETTARTHGLGTASREAERDLSRTLRGAAAGSGIFSRLGRSMAFASAEFLGFAVGASIVARSISGAENLAKAQDSLAVAIEHTGGSLKVLEPRYLATAKAAAQFGQSEEEALTGLARATVLTGDAASAQRAYQEALVISKATGKDFNAVLTATSKGQEGVVGSLQRYGILIAKGTSGTAQFEQVMERFGGQAKANTTETDRLHASIANFEATLGTALLPTVERLAGRLSDWLDRMQKSGKLQRDVNTVVHDAGTVFHVLGDAVRLVDKVTGSFANTLRILIGLKVASVLAGWAGGFNSLAAAEVLAARGTTRGRVGMYTGAGTGAAAGAVAARSPESSTAAKAVKGFIVAALTELAVQQVQRFDRWVGGSAFGRFTGLGTTPLPNGVTAFNLGIAARHATQGQLTAEDKQVLLAAKQAEGGLKAWAKEALFTAAIQHQINENLRHATSTNPFGFSSLFHSSVLFPSPGSGMFGGAKPIKQWATFQLNIAEQMAQARASLTTSTTDDVAAAKQVIARIKRAIDHGHLHGAALIQALQAEGSALTTIWSAEDAAAQKRAAKAEAAKERIDAQIQDSIDPLRLEVALSRDQALGKSTVRDLRRLRAAAEKALKSGKLSLEQQKEAWDQIASVNQQLAGQTKVRTQQFHEANTRALTAGLHLSAADRAELRARLSQLGPGGRVPRSGVGAYGYEIGPHTSRPIHVQVNLDGKKVASSTTKHQERRERRNSSQRRGPNAGR